MLYKLGNDVSNDEINTLFEFINNIDKHEYNEDDVSEISMYLLHTGRITNGNNRIFKALKNFDTKLVRKVYNSNQILFDHKEFRTWLTTFKQLPFSIKYIDLLYNVRKEEITMEWLWGYPIINREYVSNESKD